MRVVLWFVVVCCVTSPFFVRVVRLCSLVFGVAVVGCCVVFIVAVVCCYSVVEALSFPVCWCSVSCVVVCC